ncbi:MAG: hypothetical protein ACTSPY_15210 [Candidatus Helarchaeota archaeon]
MEVWNWNGFLINLFLSVLGRSLDLLSTYRVTPKFKLETNTLILKLGWTGAILIQIPIIILGSFLFQIALFIFSWSIFIMANNLAGTWFIKGMKDGEETYSNLLKESAKNAKWYNILIDESAPLFLFTIPNVIIWVLISQIAGNLFYLFIENSTLSFILIISGAAILHGIVATIRNFLYIMRLKRKIKHEEEPKIKEDVKN